jgi:hypothetical protein
VTGLTVEWYGTAVKTWINEGFAGGVPPAGWQIATTGTTGTWSSSATTNAGGTSPEARFMYGTSGTGTSRLYTGPFNTTGRTQLDLQFRTMYDAYATGVTVKVQTSTNLVSWVDTGWALVDRTTNLAATLITEPISTAEGAGSSSLYVAWVVDRNSYQLDYWYIDSVLMTSSGESITADNWLNWTLSGDDGAGANDVVQYNIYRANSAAGPWNAGALVQTVANGVATWTDVMRGQPDGINWWYVVRAVDDAGNVDTNTNAVPEIATAASWTNITVVAGWNLVSVPIAGPTTLPAALADKVGGVVWTRAMWYDPTNAVDKWKQYNTAWASTMNDLTAVDNTRSVWLYVTTIGDGQICVGGTGYSTPTTTAVQLRAGWNMVGFPSDDTTYTVANLKSACPTVTIVEQFNSGQTYLTLAMADANTFASGKGYWIYNSGADTVWNKAW